MVSTRESRGWRHDVEAKDEGHEAAAGEWVVGDHVAARANEIKVRAGSRGTVVGFSAVGGHPLVDFGGSGLVLIRAEHLARDDDRRPRRELRAGRVPPARHDSPTHREHERWRPRHYHHRRTGLTGHRGRRQLTERSPCRKTRRRKSRRDPHGCRLCGPEHPGTWTWDLRRHASSSAKVMVVGLWCSEIAIRGSLSSPRITSDATPKRKVEPTGERRQESHHEQPRPQQAGYDGGLRRSQFALRAYREDRRWHGIIIENRTPMHHSLAPAADPAACFAAAVGFLAATVDAAGESGGVKW